MMRSHPRARLWSVGVALVAALWTVTSASSARADSQQVLVVDNDFVAARIAVKPGESATWSFTSGLAAHNVSFEDGMFTSPAAPAFPMWTAMRTFTTDGIYRYYCQVHGGAGGVGMSGIVYVNATGTVPPLPPIASLTVSPTVAAVGATVTLNGTASSDPDGTIAKFEWDVDGDGVFERDTQSTATTSFVAAGAGTRNVGL